MSRRLTKKKILDVELIIKNAGSIVKKNFLSKKIQINTKQNNEFFTDIDVKTELYLIKNLQKIFPNANFVSEETNSEYLLTDGFTWIIDPIDGTNNFIRSNPHFCIAVSLKIENQTMLGFVYDPLRDEMFKAVKGRGAFLNNRLITPSTEKEISNSLVGLGLVKSHKKIMEKVKKYKEIYPLFKSLRNSGSAALDLAYLASGRLDACWLSGLKVWDFDAGILLIEESGVKINKDLVFSDCIVASNKYIFKKFSELVN